MKQDRPSPPPADQVDAAQVLAVLHRIERIGTTVHNAGGFPTHLYAELGAALGDVSIAIAAWNRRPVAALPPASPSPPKETP